MHQNTKGNFIYNFCPQLTLKTVFPVLNWHKFVALVWQFLFFKTDNLITVSPLLHLCQGLKTILTIWQNMKGEIQKFQFSNSLNWEELGRIWKYRNQHSEIPIWNLRMNLENLSRNLSFTIENKENLHKIRLVAFQT